MENSQWICTIMTSCCPNRSLVLLQVAVVFIDHYDDVKIQSRNKLCLTQRTFPNFPCGYKHAGSLSLVICFHFYIELRFHLVDYILHSQGRLLRDTSQMITERRIPESLVWNVLNWKNCIWRMTDSFILVSCFFLLSNSVSNSDVPQCDSLRGPNRLAI